MTHCSISWASSRLEVTRQMAGFPASKPVDQVRAEVADHPKNIIKERP
jgi:hypothetical protein